MLCECSELILAFDNLRCHGSCIVIAEFIIILLNTEKAGKLFRYVFPHLSQTVTNITQIDFLLLCIKCIPKIAYLQYW